MGRHVGPVLAYLERTFSIGAPSGIVGQIMDVPFASLFDAEIAAIGQNRQARGPSGRLIMSAAEFLRSRSFSYRTNYRTDYGLPMRRIFDRPPLDRVLGPGGRYGVRVDASRTERLVVEVTCDLSDRKRYDLDLWLGDRWRARLRIRDYFSFRGHLSGAWRAELPFDEAIDLDKLRLSEA